MLRRGAGETGSVQRAERGAQRGAQREASNAPALLGAGIAWAGRRSAPARRKARRGPGQGRREPQDQRAARLLARGARRTPATRPGWPAWQTFRRPTRGQGGDGGDPGRGRQAGHRRRRGDAPDVSIFDRFTIFGASQRGIMRDLQPLAKVAGVKGETSSPGAGTRCSGRASCGACPTPRTPAWSTSTPPPQAGRDPPPAPRPWTSSTRPCAGSPSGARGAWSGSASSPGPTTGASSAGAGCTGGLVRRQGQPGHHGRPQEHRRLDWELGRAQRAGGYEGVEAFRAQPKNGLQDMLKAGTLSATINSTSQLIGMFAEGDLDWVVWAPPPPPASPAPTPGQRLRQRRPHRGQGPRSLVRPGPLPLRRGVPEGAEQDRPGPPATLKAVARDPHWNTVDPRIKQFVELLPFSHIRPPIVQIDIIGREMDGPEGPRRSSSRAPPPPARPQRGESARQRRHQGGRAD